MSNFKKTKIAKITTGVVGALTALAMAGGVAVLPAFAADDIASQIAALMAQIQVLQAKLNATQSVPAMGSYNFATNLMLGSTGDDVMRLQQALNGDADTLVSVSGAGSKGNETKFFGPATKAAVAKFQVKYGISPAAGYFGPLTRAKMNSMFASAPVTPVTPTSPAAAGTLMVTAASMQPANALAPYSATRIPFTKVVLTAGATDVTVSGITVERTGSSVNSVLSGVVLLDENGVQIGVDKVLNSVNRATVGETMVIRAGTSRTLTIAGNRAAQGTQGGTLISLDVVAVNTDAVLSGDMLPIRGATHTINENLSVGSATFYVSSFDPNAVANKEIGTTNYKFSGIRVVAGSQEKVLLKSLRWYQSGSVSSNDLANIKVIVIDGSMATYDASLSADGKYYTVLFGEGILIDKGMSKDVYIQGDIVGSGSAGRTVQFDIYKNTDIHLTGETYGYGIVGTPASTAAAGAGSQFTVGTPWFDGSLVTITAGAASTISKSPAVVAQNIAVNVPNQVLGGFDADFRGEAITVQSMVFDIASSSGSGAGLLTNVTLVDQNGAVVAGPVDATYVNATTQRVTFTDSVTLPLGKSTWTLKGKVASGVGDGVTYTASTNPSAWTNVRGQVTGNTISLSSFGLFSMNSVTVKAANLAVAVSPNIPAQTIVAGGQKIHFSDVQFDASQSGEDVRFSSVPLTLTVAVGTATDLTSCQVFDGTTALNSTVVNPSTAGNMNFVFDNPLVVEKGKVKNLGLKCNLSSNAPTNAQYDWGITQANINGMSITGITSSVNITPSALTTRGPLFTVGASTLTVINDNSYPGLKLAYGGATDVTVGVLNLTATNQDVDLTELGLIFDGNFASTSDLVRVKIFDGGTQVGTVTFVGYTYSATTTVSNVLLPKNTSKVLTLKADLSTIGIDQPGRSGALVKVNFNGAKGSGRSSGGDVWATGGTTFAGVKVYRSYPTLTRLSVPTTMLSSGDNDLFRFSIKADPASGNGVAVHKITLNLSTTSAMVNSFRVIAYQDAGFSNFVGGAFTNGLIATVTSPLTGDNDVVFTSPLYIPSGATYGIRVVGDVTITGTTGTASIGTRILTDSAFVAATNFMSTATAVDADTNDNLIWSPQSTKSNTLTTDVDWTNGFSVYTAGDLETATTISKSL